MELDRASDDTSENGWEDAEASDDVEEIVYQSLFDDETFSSLPSLLEACKTKHKFDLLKVIRDLELDFYGRIKLINYIRAEVKLGTLSLNVISPAKLSDDQLLKPVLENDALLFAVDDLDVLQPQTQNPANSETETIKILQAKLAEVTLQFTEYKSFVEETLDKRWNEPDSDSLTPPIGHSQQTHTRTHMQLPDKLKSNSLNIPDGHYFDSYSHNDIHETMLKDTVRTNAYADFIQQHSQLIQGRTVLDVGCGTGILSLLCARAGAAHVIAVDGAAIIARTAAIVAANGFADTITCVAGRIEQVELPVQRVDVLVSEWMGYALLFEAMLPSVLFARDKYLVPGGLMVPSHAAMYLAPLNDAPLVKSTIEFWDDVYGFDMRAMRDDGHVRDVRLHFPSHDVLGPAELVKMLDLHTVTVKDLTFRAPFTMALDKHFRGLDGFCLWFDIFFLTSPSDPIASNMDAARFEKERLKGIAFTTGPGGKETHWHTAAMLLDREKHSVSRNLESGTKIKGTIGISEARNDKRGLEIEITWEYNQVVDQQIWLLE